MKRTIRLFGRELDKDQMREVARRLVPAQTTEQFDAYWRAAVARAASARRRHGKQS